MKAKGTFIFLIVFLVVFAAVSVEAAPFYQEKTMKIIVATKPGGNYDFYGRLAARFMQKYLPESTIIVKNIPGAGHIIGTNFIYKSKPDGLTFGTFNRGLAVAQIAGLKGIQFELSKMSWLGSPASDIYALIMAKKFKTLEDVRQASVVRLATSGLGAQAHVTTELFKLMSGYDSIKAATGYMGSEAELAIMRGEVDGSFGSWSSMHPFVKDGHGVPLLFIGKKQPAGYEKVPMLEDVITATEYKPVVDLLTALNVLARPFAGPPGIPPDRMRILMNAFEKAFADPALQDIAQKGGAPIDFMNGDDALKLLKNMLKVGPDLKKTVKEAYGIK